MTDINTLAKSGWYETNHDKYKYVYLELDYSKKINKFVLSGCLSPQGLAYFPFPNQIYREPDSGNMFCIPFTLFSLVKFCDGTLLPLVLTEDLVKRYADPENIVLTSLCINISRYASSLDFSTIHLTRDTPLRNLLSEEALRVVTGSMFDYFMISVLEHKKEFDELNTSHSNIESFIKVILKIIDL